MNEEEMIKLDRQLCFRLYRASRKMIRLYQPILEELEITYPQYVTMLVMWEKDIIDFKDLSSILDLKTGTLSPILKKLESLGYLTREPNVGDNRKIWVKLTDKGRDKKSYALKIPSLLNSYMKMNINQYQKYVLLLDELFDILDKAEKNQKGESK